jgi:spermidine dehydrogenase
VDTCPAFVAWRLGAAGFAGMDIAAEPLVHSDHFHFPDGNASIARLLVNRLVPRAFDRLHDQESIVLAPLDYTALDRPDSAVRIRLEATAVRVEHIGAPDRATERAVRVVYLKDGRLHQVTAASVILACFNNIVPFLVPSLPGDQREALRYASKVPMMYTSALVRNWKPWLELGVRGIEAPNGFHSYTKLDTPLGIGGYESVRSPEEPVVVQMFRNWNKPGLPRREQNRAGRADMLAAPFETLERETRRQLNRMLGPGGFDARRDILALTVNRWPHGYSYTYDTLGDPDVPEADRPHVLGRRPFGRIAIANADAGASAFTNVAIDQAERAVQECLASRGMN